MSFRIVDYSIGIVLDAFAVAIAAGTYPAGLCNLDTRSDVKQQQQINKAKRVTLCVHGFLHNQSAWIFIRSHLKKVPAAGNLFFLNLGHPFQDLASYTNKVHQKIQAIRALLGIGTNEILEVNFIGHSMGGLVCTHYALEKAAGDGVYVRKIVTIASPMRGTVIARIAAWICPCAADMVPNSEFMKQLSRHDALANWRERGMFHHIGCGADLIVSDENTAVHGSYNAKAIPYMGHLFALYSPKVANSIVEAIADPVQENRSAPNPELRICPHKE